MPFASSQLRDSEVQNGDCRHHWVIDSPAGPTSEGRCKRCGMRRAFFNVFEDTIQQRETAAA